MDDAALYARMHGNLRGVLPPDGRAPRPGARVVELDGVVAAWSRPRPTARCSIGRLRQRGRPRAGAAAAGGPYAEAGIEAWTVWVPER